MTASYRVLLPCGLFFFLATIAHGLDIAFLSSGAHGELSALKELVREASQRKHNATVLVDFGAATACNTLLSSFSCLPVSISRNSGRKTPALFTKTPLQALQELGLFPSVVLTASLALRTEADVLSKQCKAPLIFLVEDVTALPASDRVSLGFSAFGRKENGSLVDALLGAIRGFYNSWRASASANSDGSFFASHHVITQGIPGLDVSGSSCPNVHHIGFLLPSPEAPSTVHSRANVSWEWDCSSDFIYANMRGYPTSVVPSITQLLRKVANATNSSVLWYNNLDISPRDRDCLAVEGVILTHHHNGAPWHLLHRCSPRVVLSMTLSDVLRGAVFMGSPVLYLGADEAECRQVERAKVGVCIPLSLPSAVAAVAAALYNNTDVRESIRRVRRAGYLRGGAAKALDVVQLVAQLGVKSTDFFCDSAVSASPYGYIYEGVLTLSFVFSVLIWVVWLARGFFVRV